MVLFFELQRSEIPGNLFVGFSTMLTIDEVKNHRRCLGDKQLAISVGENTNRGKAYFG
jgi:hypothetical protein